jgi:hypothetical protein
MIVLAVIAASGDAGEGGFAEVIAWLAGFCGERYDDRLDSAAKSTV